MLKILQSPETVLALGVLLAAGLAVRFKAPGLGWWERPLARIARRPAAGVLFAALFPLALRLTLLWRFPAPEARLHDEFSFLLGARTLLQGRLANPAHPLWPHFESVHILSHPTYASAFPPGQAGALAAGILFGHPWIGVCLSIGLMCGCLCWALRGWLPARWALLGSLLLGLRLGVSSYWMNSYWGGALAAAGGALVLGALGRLRLRYDWRQTAVLGAGLALLACTRSFEGAVFGIAALAVSFSLLPANWAMAVRHVIVPLACISTLLAAWLGWYFFRVTGSPMTPPYVLYRSSMTMAPHFLWQRPRPEPLYNNREMRHFYANLEMSVYRKARNGMIADLLEKTGYYWRFYLGPLLTIPLVVVPLLWRDRRTRPLLWIGAIFSLGLAGQVWHNAHYAAPAAALAILIVTMGMRRLRVWRWRNHRAGLPLIRLLPVACAVLLVMQVSAGGPASEDEVRSGWRWAVSGGAARARIQRSLEGTAARHLVMVRYGPWHDAGNEWVYNEAGIDRSRIVWARELDRFSNDNLIAYFRDRTVWLVEPDSAPQQLVPYSQAPPRAMPFVPLGAPGIESLRSVAEVGKRIHARVGSGAMLGCDQWNFYFTEVTGVMGPDVAGGCYGEANREKAIGFDAYFSWLKSRR